ncbi:MAG: ribosome recycling factor [Thiohalomonadaceae bacterium]
MLNEIKKDAETRMRKSLESLKGELIKVRTGRAHPSLLEHINVDYYGSMVPLSQVGNIGTEDTRTLTVTLWESSMIQAVEKAILTSDLGLNPSSAGTVIRIPMPPLTEERRRELTRIVRHEGEGAKVAIRNIRRDANNTLKELLKDKVINEDEERRGQDEIQKTTDRYIAEVDKVLETKEKDLMEI